MSMKRPARKTLAQRLKAAQQEIQWLRAQERNRLRQAVLVGGPDNGRAVMLRESNQPFVVEVCNTRNLRRADFPVLDGFDITRGVYRCQPNAAVWTWEGPEVKSMCPRCGMEVKP